MTVQGGCYAQVQRDLDWIHWIHRGFGLKFAHMQLSWWGLLESASPEEFSPKDLLGLGFSYTIYYLPGKQPTLNFIQYIIIMPFRNRFSWLRSLKRRLKGSLPLEQKFSEERPYNEAGRFRPNGKSPTLLTVPFFFFSWRNRSQACGLPPDTVGAGQPMSTHHGPGKHGRAVTVMGNNRQDAVSKPTPTAMALLRERRGANRGKMQVRRRWLHPGNWQGFCNDQHHVREH